MEFKFEHFNELDFVLPEEEMHDGFRKLIDKFFKREDLILCLMEITVLRKDAYGELYLKSRHDEGEEKDMYIKSYLKLVDRVKAKFKNIGSPSSFSDWYNNDTFIYLSPAKTKNNSKAKIGWEQSNISQHVQKDNKSYDTNKDELPENLIDKYLNYYVKLLEKDLNFSEYPNYAVIVKPISIKTPNRRNSIALGNLYLHFATEEPKSINFYQKLLNQFLLIWIEKKGFETFQKLNSLNINRSKYSKLNYLPNTPVPRSRLDETNKKRKISLEWYLRAVFEDSDNLSDFFVYLDKTKEVSINHFKQINVEGADIDNLLNSAFSILPKEVRKFRLANVNNEGDVNFFIKILVQRMLFLIAYLTFDLDLYGLKAFMSKGKYEVLDKSALKKYTPSPKNYLSTERYIPIEKNKKECKEKLSDFENKFLAEIELLK